MPEQDNWKEELIKLGNKSETYGMVSIHDVYDLMSQTLSSQAHALKERILKKVKIIPAINPDNSNDLLIDREQTLSAIESIEI